MYKSSSFDDYYPCVQKINVIYFMYVIGYNFLYLYNDIIYKIISLFS